MPLLLVCTNQLARPLLESPQKLRALFVLSGVLGVLIHDLRDGLQLEGLHVAHDYGLQIGYDAHEALGGALLGFKPL